MAALGASSDFRPTPLAVPPLALGAARLLGVPARARRRERPALCVAVSAE